jgi:hypothetical protein
LKINSPHIPREENNFSAIEKEFKMYRVKGKVVSVLN